MRSALAILTYVPENAHPELLSRLPEAIRSLEQTGYTDDVFIVDDGSRCNSHIRYLESLKGRYQVTRRKKNGGVCRGKNTCIRLLRESEVEVGFLAEDDIAFRAGWSHQYLAAHHVTGIHHFSWAWDQDPSGLMQKFNREINGHPIVQTSRLNGVFLTFTPAVIEQVGGFKLLPGKWGHTHTNWTMRIVKSGLAPYFSDVCHSNQFIDINRFGFQSAVSDEEKKNCERINRSHYRDLSRIYYPLDE